MNHQNVMQQYFDPQQQQANMNGFPGTPGFQSNQQSSSFNGPTSNTNPYMTSANNFQQNGVPRFSSNTSTSINDTESFDSNMQTAPNSQPQMFPNYMDPRMSGYDPRTRPNFDPMSTGMDAYSGNSNFPNKMRMNENMAALFNNPAAMAAFQRQRMGMFGPGRDGDFMTPNAPYGGFNPQAANFLQQQRFAAFQRQMQEMGNNSMQGANRSMQYPATTSGNQTPSTETSNNADNSNTPVSTMAPMQPNNTAKQPNPPAANENNLSRSNTPNKTQSPASNGTNSDIANNVQRQSSDQNNDSQRNAAMLAAAAVRAAAAASSRKAGGMAPAPGHYGCVPGYPMNPDLMQQQPFINHAMQSSDFSGGMSPSKDMIMAMNQGRGTPRNNVPPPPYSPSPFSNHSDSNHSASGSVKGSSSSLASGVKTESITNEEQNSLDSKMNNMKADPDDVTKPVNNQTQNFAAAANHTAVLSSPSTPVSNIQNNASPAPSPFQEDVSDIGNLSPSWPNTPLSPNAQKKLKAKTSPKKYDQLAKVYELIVDEEKRNFFDKYLAFMSVNGTPVTKLPIIGKKTLDFYGLFRSVCEHGGIQQVMEKRLFRDILNCLGLPNNDVTLAYMVKEQYMKYLHAYELKAKEHLLKQWNLQKQNATNPVVPQPSYNSSVPTIALNDSFQPDVKPVISSNNAMTNEAAISFISVTNNAPVTSAIITSAPSIPPAIPNQFNNSRGPAPNHSTANNVTSMANFPQPNLYSQGQDMPPGYPGYPGYQNPMFQRPPAMQSFNSMRPGMNDQIPPGWPRGFQPRQGPPELYPEGLQRMPWNPNSQRHPMSAFATPNFTNTKGKGKMPPISRDPLEQMKIQQMKLQQQQQQQHQQFQKLQQQQQKSQQKQQIQRPPTPQQQQQPQQMSFPQTPQSLNNKRFSSPDSKSMYKARMPPPQQPFDMRHQLTPTANLKREFAFPADSVEATKPVLEKRKKLTSKDLGPIEAWRIMMSLKSGLISECTWAIDTLNILLADNNTITYFHLKQLPGLLDTLMDHYRRSMGNLFEEFTFEEISVSAKTESEEESETIDKKLTDLWVGVCKNAKSSYSSNIASTAVAGNMKETLDSGRRFWQDGGGDFTQHIQTAFPNRDFTLDAFPHGIPVVTKVEEAKQRKLEEQAKSRNTTNHENDRIDESFTSMSTPTPKSEKELEPNDKETIPGSDETEKKGTKTENETNSSEPPVGCMQIIDDLLLECENESVEEHSPVIKKVLQDLEFLIPCDKKYLEDSKEFIEYLNRRLQNENRGNVQSKHCVIKQSTAFTGMPENKLSLLQRCVAMSNVFRSLSFIQGNDSVLANHAGLLSICAFTLLHKHKHAITDHSQFKLGFEERTVPNNALCDDTSDAWWESLFSIRENTLVLLANIGGHLNVKQVREDVREPLVRGLIHWIVCGSFQALDPLPTAPSSHALSAQRLCIEALAKMTINHQNVTDILRYPSDGVLEELGDVLVKHMAKKNPNLIPNREFAIILVDNLAHSERFSKVLATRKSAIRNICTFLYDAEKSTSNYLSSGGRVQPGLNAEEICGTSISLLRRAVNIILSIAKLPCNRPTLTPYTEELLTLSTSQMIDTSVLALLAAVMFELST